MAINGNAANAFMTGFMSGYKFVDDIAKKKQEQEDADKKLQMELTKYKTDAQTKIKDEHSKTLTFLQTESKNQDDNVKNVTDPALIAQIMNESSQRKYEAINSYNSFKENIVNEFTKSGGKIETAPSMQQLAPQNLKIVANNDNQQFVVNAIRGTIGAEIAKDNRLVPSERQFNITKEGYIQRKDENGKWINLNSDGNVSTNLNDIATLKPASSLKAMADEKITGYTKLKPEMLTADNMKLLQDVGIDPLTATYDMLSTVLKTKAGSLYYASPKSFFKDGKEKMATTLAESNALIAEGWTTKIPADDNKFKIDFAQYKQSPESKNMTFEEWLNYKGQQGKDIAVTQAIEAGMKSVEDKKPIPSNEAIKLEVQTVKNATTEDKKMLGEFKGSMLSYTDFSNSSKKLQELIANGKYKTDILKQLYADIIKITPSEIMNVFDAKTLMTKYNMDSEVATSTAAFLKNMSGLQVTDKEREDTFQRVFGGTYANEQVRASVLKTFTDGIGVRLDRTATILKSSGFINTAQQWENMRKMEKSGEQQKQQPPKGLSTKNPAEGMDAPTASLFQKYGYSVFSNKNGEKFIINKATKKVERVK